MNIILCDDERNFAEALREEIKNFFDNKSMQVNITWYGSGEELLKAFEGEKSDVDLLFMDIDLGAYGISGTRQELSGYFFIGYGGQSVRWL